MKRYYLPLEESAFDDIGDNKKVVVDLSDVRLEYEDHSSKIKKSLVYLRNVGWDKIDADFSSVSAEDKIEFMRQFVLGDVEVLEPKLLKTWASVIRSHINEKNVICDDCIFSDSEMTEFLKTNDALIAEVYSLINSFPVLLLTSVIKDSDSSDIEKNDTFETGVNIVQFANNEFVEMSFSGNKKFATDVLSSSVKPVWYSKIFEKYHDRLLGNLMKTTYGFILHMTSSLK